MTAEAPGGDPFAEFADAPAAPVPVAAPVDFLATATAQLQLAAAGNDVARNVDTALRSILIEAGGPNLPIVPRTAADLACAALESVADALIQHFGDFPHPATVRLGLSFTAAIVRTLTVPLEAVPAAERAQIPAWFDWGGVLCAEMEVITRYRRLAARVGQNFDDLARASSSPRVLH